MTGLARKKKTPWLLVDRLQLAELLGVHKDTVAIFARKGMPIFSEGAGSRRRLFDGVACFRWYREYLTSSASTDGDKVSSQARAIVASARLNELKLARALNESVPMERVVQEWGANVEGWEAMVMDLPSRALRGGAIGPEQFAGVTAFCRELRAEIQRAQVPGTSKESAPA